MSVAVPRRGSLPLPAPARSEAREDGAAALFAGIMLYVATAAFALWHIRLLERPPLEPRTLIWMAVGGLAPGLLAAAAPRRLRLPAAALGLVAIWVAVEGTVAGRWPSRPLRGGHGYIGALVGDPIDGGGDWLQTLLPYDHAGHPTMRVLVVLLGTLVLGVLSAAIIGFREPVVAILAMFVPFAVVSSVFAVEHTTLRGALAVALSLVLLAALRGGRPAPLAFAWTALLVPLALVGGAAPGVAKGAFLDWRGWSEIQREGVGIQFMWQPTYGALNRPKTKTTVFVAQSKRSTYWRANVLDHFNGLRWETGSTPDAVTGVGDVDLGDANVPSAVRAAAAKPVTVSVSNVGLKSADVLVPADGVVLAVSGVSSRAGMLHGSNALGQVTADAPWPVGSEYQVSYAVVDPSPSDLNSTGTRYPASVARTGLTLTILEDVEFPRFGAPGREATVQSIFDYQFYDPRVRDWREAYAAARKVVDDAKATTPYEAVVALEAWFQRGTYDEKADYSRAANGPLPAFLLSKDRRGYCQMDAGAMAVLLRMLGIPARVAQGFTEGHSERGGTRWRVQDADAHAWTEVYFPGWGWIPFEPTPTRRSPTSASGTSASFAQGAAVLALSSAAFGAMLERLNRGDRPGGPAGNFIPRTDSGTLSTPTDRGFQLPHPGRGTWTLLTIAAVIGVLGVVKRRRLLVARFSHDPRRIATALRADLVDFVRDQGLSGPIDTLAPDELARLLRREFGLDATTWRLLYERARFGPQDAAAAAAAADLRLATAALRASLRRDLSFAERCRGFLDPRTLVGVAVVR